MSLGALIQSEKGNKRMLKKLKMLYRLLKFGKGLWR